MANKTSSKKSSGNKARSGQSRAPARSTAPVASTAPVEDEDEDDLSEDDDDIETDETESDETEAAAGGASTSGEPATAKAKKIRGPRRIVYVIGASILDAKTDEVKNVVERINPKVTTGVPFDRKKGEAEARQAFTAKHGTEPEFCEGPFYIVRDPAASIHKKRETLNMNIGAHYGFNGKMGTAIHKGWSTIVNFTNNPDYVFVMYDKVVNPEAAGQKEGKKLQKPNPRFVPVKTVQDLKETQPQAN